MDRLKPLGAFVGAALAAIIAGQASNHPRLLPFSYRGASRALRAARNALAQVPGHTTLCSVWPSTRRVAQTQSIKCGAVNALGGQYTPVRLYQWAGLHDISLASELTMPPLLVSAATERRHLAGLHSSPSIRRVGACTARQSLPGELDRRLRSAVRRATGMPRFPLRRRPWLAPSRRRVLSWPIAPTAPHLSVLRGRWSVPWQRTWTPRVHGRAAPA